MQTSHLNEELLAALATVIDPELRQPITELGMVDRAELTGSVADIRVLLTIEGCPLRSTIEADVRAAVSALEQVSEVQLEISYMSPDQRATLRQRLGHTKQNPFTAPGSLTRIFAVASGKGGVGKSSATANLAAACASMGLSVGIIDADVHGFSIPGLLGITAGPTRMDDMIIVRDCCHSLYKACLLVRGFACAPDPSRSYPILYKFHAMERLGAPFYFFASPSDERPFL